MKSGLRAYDTFNDVKDPHLRTWNRVATVHTIFEVSGGEVANNYLSSFDEISRMQLAIVLKDIELRGMEVVKAELFRRINEDSDNEGG